MRRCEVILWMLLLTSLSPPATGESVRMDYPFVQDSSEKAPMTPAVEDARLWRVRSDRNDRTLVLSDQGLLHAHAGELRPDRQYRPLNDALIRDMKTVKGEYIYLTGKHVLSNSWAGRLLVEHETPGAKWLIPGDLPQFLVVGDGQAACFADANSVRRWELDGPPIEQGLFDRARDRFLLVADDRLWSVEPNACRSILFEQTGLNCLAFTREDGTLLVGTSDGLLRVDPDRLTPLGNVERDLPCTDIRCIRQIRHSIWFGTPRGAFARRADERIDYYASRRWLVDDSVVDIWEGSDDSVLILSEQGLNTIRFEYTTLDEKAKHFDELTRRRHIRYGLNSAFVLQEPGNLGTGTLVDQDNDGLWTAMYLAGELFRYAVTRSEDVLRNCYESFEAMERLTGITPMDGFPARSFERAGYEVADKDRWHTATDERWVWKGTTSSDEIVGHFFAYTIFAEIVPDETWRRRAVDLMDAIMDHIVRNDWYLVDVDGRPTRWGRWHPEYVNQFPRAVGDRRLNSVEIISFLQAAHHLTGREIYRRKAFELIDEHGYLDNIMIPVSEIGRVPGVDLSTEWNHSDDELAFLSYWNLYRYAFTEDLREKYRRTIEGHWRIERPERNPLWNFIYAMTGAEEFDLDEAIWTLEQFPLDTISWTVRNSHRKDLEFLEPNFRNQSTERVLPPDERPMSKYNGNAFRLDGGNGGRREFSGDIYLLPYWMGRYLGVIR